MTTRISAHCEICEQTGKSCLVMAVSAWHRGGSELHHYGVPLYVVTSLVLLVHLLIINEHLLSATGQNIIEEEEVVQCEWGGNAVSMRCVVECSQNCTCILDNTTVTENCTNGNMSVSQILYPPGIVQNLSWTNSTLQSIKPRAFTAFASSLQILHLSHNALHELSMGVFANLTYLEWLFLNNNEISYIERRVFAGLRSLFWLDLENNLLPTISPQVFRGLFSLKLLNLGNNKLRRINPGVFNGLRSLNWLFLQDNSLQEIQEKTFEGLEYLVGLVLQNNSIKQLNVNAFGTLMNLQTLWLSSNRLQSLHPLIFHNQTNLVDLDLNHNRLSHLPKNVFDSLTYLKYLRLRDNDLDEIPVLSHFASLQIVNLKENPLLWINKDVFEGLNQTVSVLVTSAALCCYASSIECHSNEPRSPFLTCTRLLYLDFLRVVMWCTSIIGTLGNISALYIGFKQRVQRNKVQYLFITNLTISDLVMCVYLIILLSSDIYYGEYFPANAESWQKSTLCRLAGALSVLSSEASAFLITLISMDRYLRIRFRYPFGKCRLSTRTAILLVAIQWAVALGFSIASFLLAGVRSDFYSVSEVCVGLPISKVKVYNSEAYVLNTTYLYHNASLTLVDSVSQNTHDLQDTHYNSKVTMYLSIAMFTGLNLVCFSVVGFCYTAIFIEARKSSTRGATCSNRSKRELRSALRMSLLVLTDFSCWVPIGVLSILVQAGVVEVSPTAYAWIATFVLPINSALNPFLYRFARCSVCKLNCSKCQKYGLSETKITMKDFVKTDTSSNSKEISTRNL